MAEDAKKGTGDFIRDAIIALGRDEDPDLDALRKHFTERERELLDAKLAAENAWEKSPSEEEFNEAWFSPLDILDTTDERLADDAEKWSIVQELQAGTIRAVARKAQANPYAFGAEHLVPIYPDAWRRMDTSAEHFFWKTRNLVVSAGRSDSYGHATADKERYFDIKFDPASFSGKPLPAPPRQENDDPVLMARAAVASALEVADRNPGGRPRKDYWEPLLIEMARQLYAGDLHPRRLTDIEHAMQDWLTARGHKWSETQVRLRAKSLWEAIENEAQN